MNFQHLKSDFSSRYWRSREISFEIKFFVFLDESSVCSKESKVFQINESGYVGW